MESKHMDSRDWALKCGTAFSMLYEQLAKDVYNELYVQFYRHQCPQIWTTSITAIFELIDCYGFDYFEMDGVRGIAGGSTTSGDNDSEKQVKRTHRQLYNKMGSMDEAEEEESSQNSKFNRTQNKKQNKQKISHY